MTNNQSSYWTTEISPNTFAKGLGLKELWQKKYLIWLFIKRDITVQFKQTIFGMGWYFISPLFTMFMYIVVFGRIAEIPTDDIPQPVFYLSGICLWEYFSECLTAVSGTFQTNANLFGVSLVDAGLADKVTGMFKELLAGPGAVRATLKKYLD